MYLPLRGGLWPYPAAGILQHQRTSAISIRAPILIVVSRALAGRRLHARRLAASPSRAEEIPRAWTRRTHTHRLHRRRVQSAQAQDTDQRCPSRYRRATRRAPVSDRDRFWWAARIPVRTRAGAV